MNKTTNSIKDLKEKVTLHIGPPTACPLCGMEPEAMREQFEVAWLEHRIPNTNFVFYVCPNCNVCVGNQHSAENAKKIKEQQEKGESRILSPQGKRIVRPAGGFVYPPGTDKH